MMCAQPLEFDSEIATRLQRAYVTTYAQQRRATVREALALHPGEHVLDIGTGPGFEPFELATVLGPTGRLYAIDTSDVMLQLSRQRCADQPWVEFQSADASKLPFDDATLDAAVVVQVYEYVEDVAAALAELRRVLRPGGRAVVIDSDWRSIVWESADPARMMRVLKAFEEHLIHPCLNRALPLLLKQAGFALNHAQVLSAFDLTFSEDRFSYALAHLIADFVPGRHGLSQDDGEAWREDLRRADQEGRYFFCLNQCLYLAIKPMDDQTDSLGD
jgi:ubiquinone/menaquinone biosynthesis C-methylase UbiE